MKRTYRLATLASVALSVVIRSTGEASPAGCVVRGDHVALENVSVQPDWGPGFSVSIERVPVVATARPDKPAKLEVGGVIRFKATAERIWYSVVAEAVASGGMVRMAPGSHLIGGRARGAELTGTAVMYASDVVPGEDKPADESLEAVQVRCDLLSLDWQLPEDEPLPQGDGTRWRTRNGKMRLVLRAQAKPGAQAVVYDAPTCGGEDGCFVLTGIERRGGWRKVAASNEGVQIVGWVPAAELVPYPEDQGGGYGYSCTGHHGPVTFGFSSSTNVTIRHARISVGTTIFAERGKAAWATVQGDAEFEVAVYDGEDWAMVRKIPGVTGFQGNAYVPVAALSLVP